MAVSGGAHAPNKPRCEKRVLNNWKLIPNMMPPKTLILIPPDLAWMYPNGSARQSMTRIVKG